jgi:hypothetical protein
MLYEELLAAAGVEKLAEGTAIKKNPELWEKAKQEAKQQLGGKWSARAAQLAVQKYKEDGGKYQGKKPPASKNSLVKWTKQEWQTRPGTPEKAERGGVTHRYLPKDKWDSLSKSQQVATDRKKVEGDRKGEEVVSNTAAAKVKSAGKLEKNPVGADKHRSATGGLTAAGREHFKRTEGANLKPGVKEKNPSGDKARRKGSFLTRFFTNPRGPMEDDKGRPTRLALSAQAWGEPLPKNREDAARLAEKGRSLLEKSKQASSYAYLMTPGADAPVGMTPGQFEGIKMQGQQFKNFKNTPGQVWGGYKQAAGDVLSPPHMELQHDPHRGMPEPEGSMAKSRLHHLTDTAGKLHEMIHEEDHLPAWVTDHITAAHENLSQVNSYIEPRVHESEHVKKKALIDELAKVGAISDEQAEEALERYHSLEKSKPTAKQVGRYALLGATAAPVISAAGNVLRGGYDKSKGISYLGHILDAKTPGVSGAIRGVASSAANGALSSGAIPLVRSNLDRAAEMGTLRDYLKERQEPKLAASAPTRGGFMQASEVPGFRAPSLRAPFAKAGEIEKASMATTPGGRLLSSKRVGQPKVSSPPGPSVADQVNTHGQPQPGSRKTTIGKFVPKYTPTEPEFRMQQQQSG